MVLLFFGAQVQIFDLSDLSPEDVLVMGTDGLWDVLSNGDVREIWEESSQKESFQGRRGSPFLCNSENMS
jgi:serine/threonine protein phosphatase PrpC